MNAACTCVKVGTHKSKFGWIDGTVEKPPLNHCSADQCSASGESLLPEYSLRLNKKKLLYPAVRTVRGGFFCVLFCPPQDTKVNLNFSMDKVKVADLFSIVPVLNHPHCPYFWPFITPYYWTDFP